MQTTSRIAWVDSMKAFSIMAVVLYHTNIMSEIRTAAYLVCLPAFFFVAGIFTNTSLSPLVFFKKKTIRLLTPYILFGLLSWLAWLLIGRKYGSDTDDAVTWWYPLWGQLCGKTQPMVHNRPIWFLACMISLEWVYYLISRIQRKWFRWLCIAGIAICGCVLAYSDRILVWELTSVMFILPLYAASGEGRTRILQLAGVVENKLPLLFAILVVSLIGVGVGFVYNPHINISMAEIGNPILFYLTVVSVVGLLFSLSLLIDKFFGSVRWLSYIGRNTLVLLCLHIPAFGAIKGACLLCGVPLTFYGTNAGSLFLWVATFAVLLPVAGLINRYFPFLLNIYRRPLMHNQ